MNISRLVQMQQTNTTTPQLTFWKQKKKKKKNPRIFLYNFLFVSYDQ